MPKLKTSIKIAVGMFVFFQWTYAMSQVKDTIPPVIDLNTEDTIFHEVNLMYSPVRASVKDNVSDSSQLSLTRFSNVNPFAIGIYSDRYLAIDSAGNQSTKIRWVIVGDTTPPTITSDPLIVKVQLFSKIDLTKYLILRDNYSSPDLLKDSLKVFFSDVNFNQVGNYAIEYITNDQSGNFSNECLQLVVVTRYISVEDMEEKSVSISPNPTTYSFKVAGISNSSGDDFFVFQQWRTNLIATNFKYDEHS